MVTVQQLHPADSEIAEQLAHIMIAAWRSAFRCILSDETIATYTQLDPCAAMFSQLLSSGEGTMHLARLDGQPAGLLYWLPESAQEARIEALLTIPEAWGKGVGGTLMTQALADTKAAGHSTLPVWPFAQNHRARRFYEKQGLSPTGRTRMGDAEEVEYIRKL